MTNTSTSAGIGAEPCRSRSGLCGMGELSRREYDMAMAAVGDDCAERRADDQRGLRNRRADGEDESCKGGVAHSLGRHRDGHIAHGFLALPATATVEGERTVEPPGHQRCRGKRDHPSSEWMDAVRQE